MANDGTPELVNIQPAPTRGKTAIALENARARLSNARGPEYWRSLEELAGEDGFQEMVEQEFPRHASEWTDGVSRRGFLKLMSAGMALAGLSACTKQPPEDIVPYVQQPEFLVPGKPMYYATTRPSNMGAVPLLVKSNEFRPTKIEGNPDHPLTMSLAQDLEAKGSRWGVSDAISQASILDLYDPDRSQNVEYMGSARTWGDFMGSLREAALSQKSGGGVGLRFLTDTVTSPSLAAQIKDVLKGYPNAKWYQWDAVNRDNARAGSRMAFGQYVEPIYQLDQADVVVSLDADFLSGANFPGFHKVARDFAKKRKLSDANGEMSRLYVVESQTTTTGAKADNRLAIPAWQVEQFAGALASALGVGSGGELADDKSKQFLASLAKDLQGARGKSVVIPGEQQSPAVHAIAAAINGAIGAAGKTVVYGDPIEAVPSEQTAGLKELVNDMRSGAVQVLVVIGANPVYDAPADLNFADAYAKVPLRVHLAQYVDETSSVSTWHVPMAHYLESWGDARAYDGTLSIIQPLIEPLYGGRTAYDIVGLFAASPGSTAYDVVKAYWQGQLKTEAAWRKAVHDGFIANSAAPGKTLNAKGVAVPAPPAAGGLEIVFRPDPNIFDGRYNNNGWLQELPKPISKLTWDNAAFLSQTTAKKLNLASQQKAEFEFNGRKVTGAVMVLPGFPEDTLTVALGYGRTAVGRVGSGTGFSAYALRTTDHWNGGTGLKITAQDSKCPLAITQHHFLIDVKGDAYGPMEDLHAKGLGVLSGQSESGEEAMRRQIVREATLEEFKKNPRFAHEEEDPAKEMSLFGERGKDGVYHYEWTDDPGKVSTSAEGAGHQWGMTIDMNSCVGCNACIVACQAENNIAVVGKEQVLAGREMHWLRIDTYFQTPNTQDLANPRAYFMPVPCMQCENAPCEPVCPVGATVHSPEGLNNMVYNRCVGTRYCSNNCPYKVRRFNFLLFSDFDTESLKGLRNPDVSVRSRGVMEKCTYCVQRITAGRIFAEKQDRKVRDGEVVTACAQACPTDAIVFGDIADPNSRVTRLKRTERNYAMLAELNTRPRTTYLAAIRNPNTELEPETEGHGQHA